MADKSFGVKELNLLNASGTPTITSPNTLNLNATTVAISTNTTVGNNITVTGNITANGNIVGDNSTNILGISSVTATTFYGSGANLTGISAGISTASSNIQATWDVVNNGASAYRFTGPGQDGAENNPDVYLVRGQRYRFSVNASGHPFQLRVSNGGSAYTDGVTNNGATSGNVEINVQHDAPAQLVYQCTNHGSMVGNIYIVGQHLANGANNRVLTATSAYGINAESNMTFDGDDLTVSHSGLAVNIFESTDNHSRFRIKSGSSSLAQLEFADQDDADAGEIRYDHANDRMTFHVGNNGERLRIDNTGSVVKQIFTATNTYAANDTTQCGYQAQNLSDTTNTYAALRLTAGNTSPATAQLSSIRTGAGQNDFTIQLETGNTAFEAFRVTSDGFVGINENSPSRHLHVNSGSSDIVALFESSDTSAQIQIKDGNGTCTIECLNDFRFENSSGQLVIFKSDKDVQIMDGNLVVANGHGIDFSATGNAGNSASMSNELLDDYEEGSWTPTGSWTTIVARYTKIGRMVFAGFSLRANASSGNVTIGGFPFTSDSNHAASGGIAWGLCEFNSSGGWLNGSIGDGETTATIRKNSASVLTFGSGQNNLNQNAFIRGTFIYHTA